MLCRDAEEMAQMADSWAPEHLHLQASDLGWWLSWLRFCAALFLVEGTNVAFGDKTSGPKQPRGFRDERG